MIGKTVGGNFYVLPSSTHEVLVVPDNGQLELRELSATVYEINRTKVAPQDRLSDSVQYYETETGTLENYQTTRSIRYLCIIQSENKGRNMKHFSCMGNRYERYE